MIIPYEIAKEQEEEEHGIEVPFVRKIKVADDEAQKVVEGGIHRGVQLIVFTMMYQ